LGNGPKEIARMTDSKKVGDAIVTICLTKMKNFTIEDGFGLHLMCEHSESRNTQIGLVCGHNAYGDANLLLECRVEASA